MEARVAALETHCAHILDDVAEVKQDIRGVRAAVQKINLQLAIGIGAFVVASAFIGWIVSGKLNFIIQAIDAAK